MSKVHQYFIDNINKDYYKKGFEPSVNIYKFSDEYLKSLLLDDKALKDFQSKFGYSGNLNYADFHKIETKQKILEIEKEDKLKGVRGVFYVVILTAVLFLLSVYHDISIKNEIKEGIDYKVIHSLKHNNDYVIVYDALTQIKSKLEIHLPHEDYSLLNNSYQLRDKYFGLMIWSKPLNKLLPLCVDGTVARSYGSQGSCSHHGGNSNDFYDTGVCIKNCSREEKELYNKYKTIYGLLEELGIHEVVIHTHYTETYRSVLESSINDYNNKKIVLEW